MNDEIKITIPNELDSNKYISLNDIPKKLSQEGLNLGYQDFLINRLGLYGVKELKPKKQRLAIISRRLKRFILNEDEIAKTAIDLGLFN